MKKGTSMGKKISYLIVFLIISIMLFGTTYEELTQAKEKIDSYKRDLFRKTEKFIQENPESPDLAFLYFQLADISAQVDAVDNPGKPAKLYRKVLEIDPDFTDKDVVLYHKAYYLILAETQRVDEGRSRNLYKEGIDVESWPDSLRLIKDNPRISEAIDAYNEVFKMPNSDLRDDAIYRLGNIYYSLALDARSPLKFYKTAISYFDYLAQKSSDEKYKDYGLAYRAWAKFASGLYEESIADFTLILDKIRKEGNDRLKTYFEVDAIENLAYSFVEFDGGNYEQYSIAAQKAKELFNQIVDENYGKQILNKAIEYKRDLNSPMQAMDLYNAYISLYPMSPENPSLIDSIETLLAKNPALARAKDDNELEKIIIDEKIRLVENYNTDSDWYKTNVDSLGLELNNELKIIREAYEFLFNRYYNAFVMAPEYVKLEEYKNLTDSYEKFQQFQDEKYDKHIYDNYVNYVQALWIMAGQNKTPEEFLKARQAFIDLNSKYPENESFYENEYNIFVCIDEIRNQVKDIEETDVSVNEGADSTETTGFSRNEVDSMYVDATVKFEKILRDPKFEKQADETILQTIVYNRAEIRFKNAEYDSAYVDYEKMLNLEINDKTRKHIYLQLAVLNEKKSDFVLSREFFEKALALADNEDKDMIKTNIDASIQSNAKKLKSGGNLIESAEGYLELAERYKNQDRKKSRGFVVEAINTYKQVPDYQKAIDLWLSLTEDLLKPKPVEENKVEVLTYYKNAWDIADSLMADLEQGKDLRYRFIDLYPNSNESYQLHIEIIKMYEDGPFKDTEVAAQMYMDLYENSRTIDMGEEKREDLYLQSFKLYKELGNEEKEIELSLDFEKKYPDHPAAMSMLIEVARKYKEQNKEDEFKNLAQYIHKKDPDNNLLKNIAASELQEIYMQADSLFKAKDFGAMNEKVFAYKRLESKYLKENLDIKLDDIHADFDYWKAYVGYYDTYDKTIERVNNTFLERSPQELLKVNNLTRFGRNFKGRISKLKENAADAADKLAKLYVDGLGYEMTPEQQTRLLYLRGYCFEYATEVLVEQTQKFAEVSMDATESKNQGVGFYNEFKNGVFGYVVPHRQELLSTAAGHYNELYELFYMDKEYRDEYYQHPYDKLVEWGVVTDKERINTDIALWKVNSIDMGSDFAVSALNSDWQNSVVTDSVSNKGTAYPLWTINSGFTNYFKNSINIEMIPEIVIFTYISANPVDISINNNLLTLDHAKSDSVKIDGENYYIYKVQTLDNIVTGNNEFVFKVDPANTTKFTANVTAQYDAAKLEYFRTTEKRSLVSDYTWMTKEVDDLDLGTTEIDSTWKFAGKDEAVFYKVNIDGMEKEHSDAIGIWAPNPDTTRVYSVYFYKKINIENEFLEGQINFVGDEYTSIWINGKELMFEFPTEIDPNTMKVYPNPVNLETNDLKQGENIVLVKVTSRKRSKTLYFDMQYTVKKPE